MQVSDQVLDVFRGAVIQYVELGIVRENGGHLCLHHDEIVYRCCCTLEVPNPTNG